MTPETQPESGATPQKMPLAYRLYGLFCYDIAAGKLTELIPQNTMHIFACAPFGDEVMFMGNTCTPYEHDREHNKYYRMSASGG